MDTDLDRHAIFGPPLRSIVECDQSENTSGAQALGTAWVAINAAVEVILSRVRAGRCSATTRSHHWLEDSKPHVCI